MKVTATLLATAFFFSVAAQGQTYIFGRADFPAGNLPVAIAAGDFNGDGVSDIVVANNGDNTVSILLGRPDGTFEPPSAYSTGPEPVAVATGDFNGDGNLDVAVTNGNCKHGNLGPSCSASTVSILLGNGDGTFQPHSDYPVGDLPSSLVVTDLNGDGKLDLAVANAFDGTVSILLGNGDGTFKPHVVYSTTGSSVWESVVVGDFNGDGKSDLAVSCGLVVSVLLGKGDGTFGSHIDSSAGVIYGGISLAAGDFNRDGKLDLAVSGIYPSLIPSFVSVLLGNGDGTFIQQGQYTGGSLVAAADLNGDGKLDLVLSGAPTSDTFDSIAVLLGNGDGTFQPEVQYGTGNTPFGFAVIDLNGDGKLDLAVANSGCPIVVNPCTGQQTPSGTISVLLGFGDGTFLGKTDYPTGGTFPYAITSADFNKDSKLDLAVADYAGSVSVLLGNSDGTFRPEVSYPVGQYPSSIAFGDFRNNGDVDLVSANQVCITPPCNPGTVSVLLGNGDGTFQPHVDYGAAFGTGSVAVGDFRGNGKLDLAASGSSSVSILLGNGDGTFQPQVAYLAASSGQIAPADFNQDGKLDLAMAGGSMLLGNGDGTFKGTTNFPGGGYTIAVGDFNGDGKLDLATGASSQVISILLGNGDGTFQAPSSYPTGVIQNVTFIVVTDFNNDGKADLAVKTEGVESLIFLGNGDGTFQPPIEYLLANGSSYSLTVGDFNGDGVPDWAAPSSLRNANTVGVMLSAAFKSVFPGSLSFGSQGVSTTSAPQIITVSNPSNVKIDIGSIAATGSFSQTNTCPAALTPGTNCTVNVTFSPTATGLQAGSINLTDSTRISPLAVSLNGTGVNGPFLTAHPSRKNFAPQTVGTTSNAAAIVLVNSGNAALNLGSVSITGTNSSDFTQSNSCGGSLLPAGSCSVSAAFAPTAGGSRIANLAVSDNAPGSPQMISLSGMAIAVPDFAIALASGSNSQTINAGQSATFHLAVTPSGAFTGTVSLSCAITPVVSPAPTCGLSASSVQLQGSISPSVTVTVGTIASATTGAPFRTALPPGAVFCILAFSGLAVMLAHSRRRLPALAMPVLAIGLALSMSCGGGTSQHTTGTPSGKYTATVVATSGTLSHSMALTVVVQ